MSEMNKDFVSIIIPNYNRQELVSVSLESLCQQTYSAWEALVVDDGSTDDSVKIIKNFCERDKRIRLFNNPKARRYAETLVWKMQPASISFFLTPMTYWLPGAWKTG